MDIPFGSRFPWKEKVKKNQNISHHKRLCNVLRSSRNQSHCSEVSWAVNIVISRILLLSLSISNNADSLVASKAILSDWTLGSYVHILTLKILRNERKKYSCESSQKGREEKHRALDELWCLHPLRLSRPTNVLFCLEYIFRTNVFFDISYFEIISNYEDMKWNRIFCKTKK